MGLRFVSSSLQFNIYSQQVFSSTDEQTMTDLQALLASHQNTRLLRMSFPRNDGPQATLMVNRFVGTEYVSRDFAFTVELLSDDARIELETMQGKLLCISLVQADGSLRPFTGYVTSFKLVKTDGGVAFYEATLAPWLAYTRLRRNNRLFHAQSLREQAETIFDGYGGLPAFDWKVASEQPQFTIATQGDETDHNYLCRRWERRRLQLLEVDGWEKIQQRSSKMIETFSELISSIASDLRQGGFIKDANELQHLANLALDHTCQDPLGYIRA